VRPASVLDLGCGSGILALCAARLFDEATRIIAIDNDPEASATAQENVQSNGLTERIEVRTGDHTTLAELGAFELVVANIRPSVLIPIASDLLGVVAINGSLTVSGILPEEAPSVADAYRSAGWQQPQATRIFEGWSGLDFMPPQ
jgi:ribosomal protein L11 methyltransferase